MHWVLIALAFVTVQPKAAEHVRTLANRRVRAERKAEVPVPPPPGASTGIQIPITGSGVDSAGVEYTFSGVVTLTRKDPPPPPVPVITGVRAAGGTAFINEALGGAPLELVGVGLPSAGQLRLTVGDKTATVRLWTPTVVFFTAPGVTAPFAAPVKLWQQVNNNWTLVAQGPILTLKVGFAEVPTLPRVDRFLAANGTAKEAFSIREPLTLIGVGFGPNKGRVLVNWLEVPVTAWSETRIQTTAGDGITGRDPQGKPFPSHWAIKIVSGPFGLPQPLGWCSADGPGVVMPP